MIELFKKYFINYYRITKDPSKIEYQVTDVSQTEFDLIDSVDPIVETGQGVLSIKRAEKDITEIFGYDRFISSIGRIFDGKRRCDYLLYDKSGESFIVLTDLTSGKDLDKPIKNNQDTSVEFKSGKFEKVKKQLLDTLEVLTQVVEIAKYLNNKKRRICLMGYEIVKDDAPSAVKAFNKYREIESRETKENGAVIPYPEIEAYGFKYIRISHDYVFKL